jgi:hypothetical protein
MPFPLQHTKGNQAAREMMQLSPPRPRLTVIQPELILTHPNDFLDVIVTSSKIRMVRQSRVFILQRTRNASS